MNDRELCIKSAEALEECLDALALYHIQPRLQGEYSVLSTGEYAQHLGEKALEEMRLAGVIPWPSTR